MLTKEENPQMFNITNIMLNIFSLDDKAQEYFDIKADGNLDKWTLLLTPKDDLIKKIFTTIKLQGDDKLNKLELKGSNADETIIEFSNYDFSKSTLSEKEKDYFEK